MKNTKGILSFLFLLFLFTCCSSDRLKVYELQSEMLNNPLGIDNASPHFGWKIDSKQVGTIQNSYQILAASDQNLLNEDKADLWNSGKIDSDETTWVSYGGKELSSKSLVYWKVRVWDEKGNVSDWSPVSYFSVGLLKESDWTGKYIGGGFSDESGISPLLRKTFDYTDENKTALLHVNSLGYHEVYINGTKVSDVVLAPAVSKFGKRSLSMTYDVTEYLQKGENELVLWLGKGWYRKMSLVNVVERGPYVRAQLESYAGGNWTEILKTDDTWKARNSGYSDPASWRAWEFGGETVDANELLADLTSKSLNAAEWKNVEVADIPVHPVSPQMSEPNRITESIKAVSIKQLSDTSWVVDMGKNITGWTEIKFPQLEKSQKIQISYCDFLKEDSSFNDKNDCDYYIASGGANEVFTNKFNYHCYRYIKLSNIKESPLASDISSHLIHTDYAGESSFSCSDDDMNAIHDMIHYTIRCLTLGGYMVDCSHIERLGYGGDGNASTTTVQTMYNMASLYNNWMLAWGDCAEEDGGMPHTAPNPYTAGGGPYWCGFIITASWNTYVNYGDMRLLEKYYPIMQKWLSYVDKYTVDGLLKPWPAEDYRGTWYLGDWATPRGIDQRDERSIDLVNNCYISQCYNAMSKIALVLGHNDDKAKYEQKRVELNNAIHSKFFLPESNSYSTGTQIDLVYPLLVGATPDEKQEDVLQTLYNETENRFTGNLSTGLVGVQILTEWATHKSEAEFMYKMLKKRTYPGYLYMIDNGATATWEHWDGDRSHVHNCYNGIGSWFYQALGGILPDENNPGYKHLFIKPQLVDGISWVKASKDIPQGKLAVEWKLENNQYILDVEIPVGSTATVILPVKGKVSVNNEDIGSEILLSGGKHQIVCKM